MRSYLVKKKCYFGARLYEAGQVVELEGKAPAHFEPLDAQGKAEKGAIKSGGGESSAADQTASGTAITREELEKQAKDLGVRGCLANMKDQTLLDKVQAMQGKAEKGA